ncbi:chemotaxis protein CheA [bacterium]|nr:chemotaxis protein CheA [bacterium]MBU1989898.1 chemotaxis protein CheA [bacterium]
MDEDLALFYEDSSDQLQYMENALLDIIQSGITKESIGELFRAMHTIKGIAGMFGFDEIVHFTHKAESLLDNIRQDKIAFTDEIQELFLQVKDHTSKIIEQSVNEDGLDEQSISEQESLISIMDLVMSKSGVAQSVDEKEERVSLDFNELVSLENHDMWHVSIRFADDFFTSGMDILSIFNYFNKLGYITFNTPIVSNIPSLEDLDSLKTYIGFELEFQSSASKEDIEEIFEFVENDVVLFIFKSTDEKAYDELFNTYEGLEEILLGFGIYAKEDLEEDKVTQKIEKPIQATLKVPKMVKKEIAKSLRVDSAKIDFLINKMSEVVIANAKIETLVSQSDDSELIESVDELKLLLEDVRDNIMGIRMVPVEESFIKLRRIVNDTAKKLSKEVEFIIEGGETELDKTVIEKISDPLVHMLRNSVDHGIEMPDVRKKRGKSGDGRIVLRAFTDAGMIVIEIEDDGAGINKEIVLKKAIEKGLISAEDNLSDKEINNLIFEPGFSTASEISDISGRGVGMDVVKSNIESLRGSIEVNSTELKGSCITIRLPLTLAIIDGFLVQAGDTKYIIPLEMIRECIELTPGMRETMKENSYITIRGQVLPILDIKEHFREKCYPNLRENIVIVQFANEIAGLKVDELYGEIQAVIKPLGDIFSKLKGLSGGTILGSGEIALIFDIVNLIENKIERG